MQENKFNLAVPKQTICYTQKKKISLVSKLTLFLQYEAIYRPNIFGWRPNYGTSCQ